MWRGVVVGRSDIYAWRQQRSEAVNEIPGDHNHQVGAFGKQVQQLRNDHKSKLEEAMAEDHHCRGGALATRIAATMQRCPPSCVVCIQHQG